MEGDTIFAARSDSNAPRLSDLFSWPGVKPIIQKQLGDSNEAVEAVKILRGGGPQFLEALSREEIFGHMPGTEPIQTISHVNHTIPQTQRPVITFPSFPLTRIQALSAAYFDTYNSLYPLVDPQEYYSKTLPDVIKVGFCDGSVAPIIVLLVMALGQCALDGSHGAPMRDEAGHLSGIRGGGLDNPPGLQTFNEARRRMGFELTHYSLEHIQMFCLTA